MWGGQHDEYFNIYRKVNNHLGRRQKDRKTDRLASGPRSQILVFQIMRPIRVSILIFYKLENVHIRGAGGDLTTVGQWSLDRTLPVGPPPVHPVHWSNWIIKSVPSKNQWKRATEDAFPSTPRISIFEPKNSAARDFWKLMKVKVESREMEVTQRLQGCVNSNTMRSRDERGLISGEHHNSSNDLRNSPGGARFLCVAQKMQLFCSNAC